MGCCLTTAAAKSEPRDDPPPPPAAPAFEEETVKEVLSETPIKPTPSTVTEIAGDTHQILHPGQKVNSRNGVVRMVDNPIEENASEISTEMYSYSGSFSAATTTTLTTDLKRDKIDQDGEVTQKVNKPPPAKMAPRRRPPTSSVDRVGMRERGIRPPSPTRRSAVPSPERKWQPPSRNVTTAQRNRNVGPSNVVRREPPARRSRSPAMRGESGQVRKVERIPVRKSGNRVPVKMPEKEEKVKSEKSNDGGVVPAPETNESLENPRVSLECFIFL